MEEIFIIMLLALSFFNTALIAGYMRRPVMTVQMHIVGGAVFVYAAIRFVMMTWR